MGQRYQKLQLPSLLLKGLVAGLATTLLIAIITASLISVETIGEEAGDIGVMVALLCGSLISAIVASGKTERMRLGMCLAGSGVYFLVLLCSAPILFDGIKSGFWTAALLTLGGSITAALLGKKKEKRRPYKVPKLRN